MNKISSNMEILRQKGSIYMSISNNSVKKLFLIKIVVGLVGLIILITVYAGYKTYVKNKIDKEDFELTRITIQCPDDIKVGEDIAVMLNHRQKEESPFQYTVEKISTQNGKYYASIISTITEANEMFDRQEKGSLIVIKWDDIKDLK